MDEKTLDQKKAEIARLFKDGKIDADELVRRMADLTKRPFRLDVGDKGWLKIAFDGFRFPVNLAYEQAIDLFSPEGVKRVREYLEENRTRFKVKNK